MINSDKSFALFQRDEYIRQKHNIVAYAVHCIPVRPRTAHAAYPAVALFFPEAVRVGSLAAAACHGLKLPL